MTTPAPEMPAWDYALFAAREFWLSLGGEVNDHTLAATAMLCTATAMLADTLGYDDAMKIAKIAVDPSAALPGARAAVDEPKQ